MKSLNKCIQFQMKKIIKNTIFFLFFYTIFYAAFILLLISLINPGPNSRGNMNAGFYFTGAIFAFIIVASNYKSTFNYMLLFGNTRRNILISSVASIVLLSVLLSVVSVLFDLLDTYFTKRILHDVNMETTNLLNIFIYKDQVNIATGLLWYAAIFIMISSFALLYGSLSYKFGKTFITAFWLGLCLFFTVVPAISGANFGDMLVRSLSTYFCVNVPNGMLLAPLNFIITAVIFSAATYYATIRQSQVA